MRAGIFDFDGTLAEKNLGYFFAEHLTRMGIFSETRMDAIKRHVVGQDDYVRMMEAVRREWAKGLVGQEEEEVIKEAKAFARQYILDGLHPGTPELLRFFKDYGFFTAVISASPIEVLEAVLADFGIDVIVGTSVEAVDGVYTGKLDTSLDGTGKGGIIKNLFEEHDPDPLQSFSFGDTLHDVPLLGFPGIKGLALHPDNELERIAGENGWPVFHDTFELLDELMVSLLLSPSPA